MKFINTYFSTKIRAIGRLLTIADEARDERIWLAYILVILWAVVCTIGGLLMLPIDFIYSAIAWRMNPDFREVIEDLNEELEVD